MERYEQVYYMSNRMADFMKVSHGSKMSERVAIRSIMRYLQLHEDKLIWKKIVRNKSCACEEFFEPNDTLRKILGKESLTPCEIVDNIAPHLSHKEFPPPLPIVSKEKKRLNSQIRVLYDAPPRDTGPAIFRRAGEGFREWETEMYRLLSNVEHLKVI